jgi:quinol monooxygenase YgiN
MTSAVPLTRTAIFRARDGHGEPLAERLLHAAALVAEAPGCELWLVHRDLQAPDTVRVCEVWASREQCDASLGLPGVRETAAQIMKLLAGPPEVVDGQLVGGARMVRGQTGASRVSRLLHVLGGSGSDGPSVELADDEVDHRDEVAVGSVSTGSAFRGLDQRVEALQESV